MTAELHRFESFASLMVGGREVGPRQRCELTLDLDTVSMNVGSALIFACPVVDGEGTIRFFREATGDEYVADIGVDGRFATRLASTSGLNVVLLIPG